VGALVTALWLALGLARAQETVPEPVPAEPVPAEPVPAEPAEEVVVWGRLAVDKARDAVVKQFEGLGYEVARRKDGRVIFRGKDGKITLLPSGDLVFGAAPPRLVDQPAESYTQDPRYEDLEPGPMAPGPGVSVALPGGEKVQGRRDEILRETRDELDAYTAVVRRTAFEEMLQALPDRLDRLWTDGVPLDPNAAVLPTPEARRRAVLEHWATRTDTPEGRRTCAALEAWLSSVVQSSEAPITDAERQEFEARRKDGRELP
jgi:hypothetical protein